MEEDERKQKLKAGKDKLALFQKRKKKRKWRPADDEARLPGETVVGDVGDTPALVPLPSDASSYDSDQMSLDSSISEDDLEAKEPESRYWQQVRCELRDKALRVEELEENLMGKQLALDKVIRENDELRQHVGTRSNKASDDNMNMVLSGAGLNGRDIAMEAGNQPGAQSETVEQGASHTDVVELTQHVKWLQAQLQQTSSTLHLQADRQTETVQSLQSAKMEIFSLRDNLVEKDELVTDLAEKLTVISTEYGTLKESYSEMTKQQSSINGQAGINLHKADSEKEFSTQSSDLETDQKEISDTKAIHTRKTDVINLTEELKEVKADCQKLYLDKSSLKEQLNYIKESKLQVVDKLEETKLQNSELENEVLHLKDEHENSRSEIIKLAKEIINVKAQKAECETEITSLNSNLSLSNIEKEILADQLNEFKDVNDKLMEEIKSRKERSESEGINYESLESNTKCLSEELAALKHEHDLALSQILSYQAQMAEVENRSTEIGDLMEENHSLRTQNDDLYNKINNQKDIIAQHRADIDTFTCENVQLNDQIQSFTASLEECRDVIGDWQKENEELQAEVSDLKSALIISQKENSQCTENIAFLNLDIETLKKDLESSSSECKLYKSKLAKYGYSMRSDSGAIEVEENGNRKQSISAYEVTPDVEIQYTVISADNVIPSESSTSADKSSSITVLDSDNIVETISDMSVLSENLSSSISVLDNDMGLSSQHSTSMDVSGILPLLDSEKLSLISSLNRSENSVDISSSIAIIDSETSAEMLSEHKVPNLETSNEFGCARSNDTVLSPDLRDYSESPFLVPEHPVHTQTETLSSSSPIVPSENRDIIIANLQHDIKTLKSQLCKCCCENTVGTTSTTQTPVNNSDSSPEENISSPTVKCDRSPDDTDITSENRDECETSNDTAYTTLDYSKSDNDQPICELKNEIILLRNQLEQLKHENELVKARNDEHNTLRVQCDDMNGRSDDQHVSSMGKPQAGTSVIDLACEEDVITDDSTHDLGSRKVSDVNLPAASGMEVNLHASSSPSCHGSFGLFGFVPAVTVTDNVVIVEDDKFQNPEVTLATAPEFGNAADTENNVGNLLHYGEAVQSEVSLSDNETEMIRLREQLEKERRHAVGFHEQQQKATAEQKCLTIEISRLQQIVKTCLTEKHDLIEFITVEKEKVQNAVECKCRVEELNKKLLKDIENHIVMYNTAQTEVNALNKSLQHTESELKYIHHENELLNWQKNELEIKLTTLDQEVISVKTAKCDLESKGELIQDELETVRDRLDYLESSARDCFEMKEIVESIQEQNNEICKENESLQGQLSFHIEDNKKLLDSLDLIYKENSDLQSELVDYQEKATKLENDLSEVKKYKELECLKFVGEIEGLLEEGSTLKTKIKACDSELENLTEENERLQGYFPNIDAQSEEIDVLTKRNLTLQKHLDEVSVDQEKHIQEIIENQLKLENTEKENEAMFEKYIDQQQILEQLEDEKTLMLEQIETLKHQLTQSEQDKKIIIERLNGQLEGLDEENSTLKTQVACLHSDLQECDDQIQLFENKYSEQTELIKGIDEHSNELAKDNLEYKSKVSALRKELLELGQKVQLYGDTLTEKVNVTSHLEAEVKDLVEEKSYLVIKVGSLEHDAIEMKESENNLKKQVKTYEVSFTACQDKIEEFDNLISELEYQKLEIKTLQVDFDKTQSVLKSNKVEIQELHSNLENVQHKCAHFENAAIEHQETHNEIQCGLTAALKEKDDLLTLSNCLESELKNMTEHREQLQVEISNLKMSLQCASENGEHYKNQMEMLITELETLSISKEDLTEMLNKSELNRETLYAENCEFRQYQKSLQDENEKLKCEIETLSTSETDMNARLHASQSMVENLKVEQCELSNHLELAQHENKQLMCDIEKSLASNDHVNSTLHESVLTLETVNAEKQDLKVLLELVQNENKQMKSEIEALADATADDVTLRLNEAELSIQTINAEKYSLQDSLHLALEENEKLKSDIDTLIITKDAVTTKLSESECNREKLHAERCELKDLLNSALEGNEMLKSDVETLTTSKETLASQLCESVLNREKLNAENVELKDSLLVGEGENENLKSNIHTLVTSNDTLTTQLCESDSSKETMNAENCEFKDLLHSAQEQNENVKSNIHTLATSNDTLTTQLCESDLIKETMDAANCELTDLLHSAQEANKKLKSDIVKFTTSQDALTTQLSESDFSKDKLHADKCELKRLLNLVQEENEQFKSDLATLTTAKDTLTSKLCEFDLTVEKLNAEKSSLQNLLHSAQEENENVKSNIHTLATSNDTLTTQLCESDLIKETMDAANCELTDLLHSAQEANKKLKSDIVKFTTSQDALTTQLSESDFSKDKLHAEKCELKRLLNLVQEENEQFKSDLETLTTAKDTLTSKLCEFDLTVEKLNAEKSSLQNVLHSSQEENENVKSNIHSLATSNDTLTTQVCESDLNRATVNVANFELTNLIHSAQDENEMLTSDRNTPTVSWDTLTTQLRELDFSKEELKVETCELKNLLHLAEKESKYLKSDIDTLTTAKDTLTIQLSESDLSREKLNTEKCKLDDVIQSIMKENETLMLENSEMKASQMSSSDKIRRLEADLEAETNQLNVFLASVQERINKAEHIMDDKLRLENRNTHLNEKIEELSTRVEQINSEKEILEKLTTDLTSMLHDMQTKYEEVKSDMEATKKKCDKDIGLLQTQLQTMNKDVQDLRELLDLMENEMYSASEEKAILKTHLDQQQAQYHEAVEQKQKLEEILTEKHQKDLKNQRTLSQQLNQRSDANSRLPDDRHSCDIDSVDAKTVVSQCSTEVQTDFTNEELVCHLESNYSGLPDNSAALQYDLPALEVVETLPTNNIIDPFELISEVTEPGESLSLDTADLSTTDLLHIASTVSVSTECQTDNVMFHEYLHSFISQNELLQHSNVKEMFTEIDTDEMIVSEADTGLETLESFSELEPISESTLIGGEFESCLSDLGDEERLYLTATDISEVVNVDARSLIGPVTNLAAEMAMCHLDVNSPAGNRKHDIFSQTTSMANENTEYENVLENAVSVEFPINQNHDPNLTSNGDTVANLKVHNGNTTELTNESNDNGLFQNEMVDSSIQTEVELAEEMENEMAEKVKLLEREYEQRVIDTEAEVEDRLNKRFDFRELKIKLLEDNYEKKVKQIEYEIEEKHQQLFRKREVEIIIEAEKDKLAHAKEVEQDAKRKIEQIKIQKDKQFVETMQKVRADFSQRHRQEGPGRQNDRAHDDTGSRDGPGSDATNQQQSHGTIIDRLNQENQELAMARDALLQRIDLNRQHQQQIHEQLQNLMADNEMETTQENPDIPSWLDWDLSPEFSFGSLTSSVDTKSLSGELDINSFCSKSSCLSVRMKYEQLVDKIQKFQSAFRGDISEGVTQNQLNYEYANCSEEAESESVSASRNKFMEHSEPDMQILERITSIDLEHSVRVPPTRFNESQVDKFVADTEDATCGKTTAEINSDVIDQLISLSSDQNEGHFSLTETDDELSDQSHRKLSLEQDEIFSSVNSESKSGVLDSRVPPFHQCHASFSNIEHGHFLEADSDDAENEKLFTKSYSDSESTGALQVKRHRKRRSQKVRNSEGHFVKNTDSAEPSNSESVELTAASHKNPKPELGAVKVNEHVEINRSDLKPLDIQGDRFVVEMSPMEEKPPGSEEMLLQKTTAQTLGSDRGDFFEENIVPNVRTKHNSNMEHDSTLFDKVIKTADSVDSSQTDDAGYVSSRATIELCSNTGNDYFMEEKIDSGDILENIAQDLTRKTLPTLEFEEKYVDQPEDEILSESVKDTAQSGSPSNSQTGKFVSLCTCAEKPNSSEVSRVPGSYTGRQLSYENTVFDVLNSICPGTNQSPSPQSSSASDIVLANTENFENAVSDFSQSPNEDVNFILSQYSTNSDAELLSILKRELHNTVKISKAFKKERDLVIEQNKALVLKSEELCEIEEQLNRFKNQNEDLCFKMAEMESKLCDFSELESLKDILTAEVVKLKVENDDIKQSLSAELDINTTLIKQNAQHELALEELTSMNLAAENLQSELDTLKDDKEWLEKTSLEQQSEKQHLDQQNITVMKHFEEIQKLKSAQDELCSDYKKLKQENENLSDSVNGYSEMKETLSREQFEHEKLKQKYEALEEELGKSVIKYNSVAREYTANLEHVVELKDVLSAQDNVNTKIAELDHEKDQLEETVFVLADENESISSKLYEMKICFEDKFTQLNHEKGQLKEVVDALHLENASLSAELNQAMSNLKVKSRREQEKEKLEGTLRSLSNQHKATNDKLEQAVMCLEEKVVQLNHENKQLEENVLARSNENESLNNDLDKVKDLLEKKQAELNNANTQHEMAVYAFSDKYKSHDVEMKQKIDSLEDKLQKLNHRHESVQDENNVHDFDTQSNTVFPEKLAELSNEKCSLEETIHVLSDKYEQLSADKNKQLCEMDILKNRQESLIVQSEFLQRENTELREILNVEKENYMVVEQDKNELDACVNKFKYENQILQENCTEHEGLIDNLKHEKDELNNTLSAIYKDNSQLLQENADLNNHIRIKCDENNSLKQKIEILRHESTELQESNLKLKELNVENEWAIKELALQVEGMEQENSHIKQEVVEHVTGVHIAHDIASPVTVPINDAKSLRSETGTKLEKEHIEKTDSACSSSILQDLKDVIDTLQEDKVNLKDINESLKAENYKLIADVKRIETENKLKEEVFYNEKSELLKMYSALNNEVELLVITKQELEDEVASMKLELDLEITKDHDTSRELTMEDIHEMEDLKSSISSLKKDIKDKDFYVRKLEEHLLNVDRGLPDLASTPKPKTSSGVPKVSKSFIGRRTCWTNSSRKDLSFDRHDDYLLDSSMIPNVDCPMQISGVDQNIVSESDLTSPSSVSGAMSRPDEIKSGYEVEDGHRALELKQYELVDEISQLKRDLRETKAIYTQETALLTEALEHGPTLKQPMQSPGALIATDKNSSQSLYELKLSQDTVRLRHTVASLKEENKRLKIENERWLNRIKEQERIVSDLKERLSRNTSGIEDIEEVFGRQLALLQKQREELLDRLHDCELNTSKLSIQLGEKTVMEDSLRREKDILIVKLDEKGDIEAELHEKQLELERQKLQQRHLEELVYQKDINEQELMKQKRLLEQELLEIESKYRDREENLSYDKNQLLDELRVKCVRPKSRMSDSEDDCRSACSDNSGVSDRQIGRLEVMLEEVEKQHSKAVQVLRDQLSAKYDKRERRLHDHHAAALSSLRQEQSKQVLHK